MNTQPATTPQPTPGPTKVSKKRMRHQAYRILMYWSLIDFETHFTFFLPQPPTDEDTDTTTSTPEPSKAPTKVRQDQY